LVSFVIEGTLWSSICKRIQGFSCRAEDVLDRHMFGRARTVSGSQTYCQGLCLINALSPFGWWRSEKMIVDIT